MKQQPIQYVLHTLPGFDVIVREELKQLPERATIKEHVVHAGRNGLTIIDYDGDVDDLLKLRTVDDVFILIGQYNDLPPKYSTLKVLRDKLEQSPVLNQAVKIVRTI